MIFLCLTLLFIFFLMKNSSSPFKISLFMALMSSISAMYMYVMSNSMFLSCSLIISFSSGMMILFSYCSMSSFYEYKNKTNSMGYLSVLSTMVVSLILMAPQSMNFSSMTKLCNMTSLSLYLVFLMFMVIVCMKSINVSLFNPTKKLMQSY